jgi:hypothetical protein
MWLRKPTQPPKPATPATATPTAPAITAATIAEAKRNPGGWVYAMDGVSDPNGAVPPERIKGCWKVSEHGEIVGEFIFNPNYRQTGRAT